VFYYYYYYYYHYFYYYSGIVRPTDEIVNHHWKDSVLVRVLRRRGHATLWRATWGSARGQSGGRGAGEHQARVFIVVSTRRNRIGRVSKLRMG
jgi:hypothetical protein